MKHNNTVQKSSRHTWRTMIANTSNLAEHRVLAVQLEGVATVVMKN